MTLALAIVVKSWREVKNSPYYFMRRQAEKRLQTYSFASLCLIIATALTAVFTLQEPVEKQPLVAVLTNTKPATEEVVALMKAAPAIEIVAEADIAPQILNTTNQGFIDSTDELVESVLALPSEFDQIEPEVELNDGTELGSLAFSTKINPEYEAVNPTNVFEVGDYTLYATFSYDGMADGMAWSWVWRHDGEVVDGGNDLWAYGQDGPGYIYFGPEEGFNAGEYSLEVWVNGELFTLADVTMTGSALSAGN